MSRERYELVTAAELKPGDQVFCEYKLACVTLASQRDGDPPWMWDDIEGETWGWEDSVIFRLIPANEEDVLRRALEMAVEYMSGTDKDAQKKVVEEFIDDARRQLASEASETKGGE